MKTKHPLPSTKHQARFNVSTLLTLLTVLMVRAQQYTIDWFTIAGGGGSSSNGQYSVSGTIGQHDADGPMSGGNYSLTGGFWAVYAAQTPSGPLLTITRSGANVIVSWPSPSTGFGLQQNGSVANPNGWSSFGGTPNDNGTVKSITVSPPTGSVFYRLKK